MSDATRRGLSNLAKMLTARSATLAILVGSALIIPRVLGVEDYGHYAAVMAVVAIVQTISALGLTLVEVRYLSPLWQEGDVVRARALASSIWAVRLILSAVGGLLAIVWLGSSSGLELLPALVVSLGALTLFRGAFEASRTPMLALANVGKMAGFEVVRAALTLLLVVTAYWAGGLSAVYSTLALGYGLLFLATHMALRRVVPVGFRHFRWDTLRPRLGYGLRFYLGSLASVVQTQFSIYALATWVARAEAGLLALTLQIYALLQTAYGAAQSALMPILAEMESRGLKGRLRYWGGVMMRYGAAGAVLVTVGWALLGSSLLDLLLPRFVAVHRSGTVILFGVVLYCCGAPATALLAIRGRSGLASIGQLVYATVTIFGLLLAIAGEPDRVVLAISCAHTIAAAVYFLVAYFSLGLQAGIWLPLRRTALLCLPVIVAWPVLTWGAPLAHRLVASSGFVVLYLCLAVILGLLPVGELRAIKNAISSPLEND